MTVTDNEGDGALTRSPAVTSVTGDDKEEVRALVPCHTCNGNIGPGETVVWARCTTEGCELTRWRHKGAHHIDCNGPGWRWNKNTCLRCRRPFYWFGAGRYYCSTTCSRAAELEAARRRRQARRGVTSATCATCEASYTPTRSDARYCSSACRQKAYRDRRAGDGS